MKGVKNNKNLPLQILFLFIDIGVFIIYLVNGKKILIINEVKSK